MTAEPVTEKLFYYTVLRYVPRPQRGEFVNFAVIVADASGGEVATEFTADWKRARQLGRTDDVALLRKLARQWKRELRGTAEVEQLFRADPKGLEWMETLAATSANIVQAAEPKRAFGTSVSALARELYDDLVGQPQLRQTRRAVSKRGLQLSLEAEFRRRGLGEAFERNYEAVGANVHEWVFDYAVKNGRPFHFIQTLSFRIEDHHSVLADVAYAAYARRDLRASALFADVPVTVLAEPPDDDQSLVSEARALLGDEEIPLLLREDVESFVNRLEPLVIH